MSVRPSHILNLHPSSPPHYSSSPTFTFHPYEHDAAHDGLHDDAIAPPALSTKRASRLSAPFPTFLYASEPPPVTARNKQRVRPNAAQLAELKALYATTPHPARESREALGRKIGMRYQSVTNWFQNQRSTAKKRAPAAGPPLPSRPPSKSRSRSRMSSPGPASSPPHVRDDDVDETYGSEEDDAARGRSHERYMYAAPQPSPPLTRQRTDPVRDIIVAQAAARQQQLIELALPLSGDAIVPSSFSPGPESYNNATGSLALNITLPPVPRTTSVSASSRAPTPPLLSSFQVSRAPSPNLSIATEDMHSTGADYGDGTALDQVPRGKRSRPTPHQLSVLRALHAVTSSPSIEERTKVGREIGMELGKVTNWFRNLRQTARKKERRVLEVEGVAQPGKRIRNGESTRSRHSKRSRLALDEDEEDTMSFTASISHTHSGAFDTSSTVGSVDMDYQYERSDAYYEPPRGEDALTMRHDAIYDRRHQDRLPAGDGVLQLGRHSAWSSFNHRPESPYTGHHYDPPSEGRLEHEHDHEARSEQGTDSDATHEAVTPEPHGLPPPSHTMSTTPHATTPPSSRDSPSPPPHPRHTKHASVDDAMLLLAFHGAQA